MNSLSMLPMHMHLSRKGFRVARFGYASVRRSPSHNAERLARFIASLPDDLIYLVGHSMGGVMILQMLKKRADSRIGRVVLLGSPVTGSRAGRDFSRSVGGRWMLGHSLPLWAEGITPQAPVGVEVGVIAGDVPLGLGRIFVRLEKPNDGVVAVEEARIEGAADTLVMRVNHSGMILSASVARQVCSFLKVGEFARA
jgi:pimeloyl-ACP methyl ester carboxylesterase